MKQKVIIYVLSPPPHPPPGNRQTFINKLTQLELKCGLGTTVKLFIFRPHTAGMVLEQSEGSGGRGVSDWEVYVVRG